MNLHIVESEMSYAIWEPHICSAIKLPKLSSKYCALWVIIEKIREVMRDYHAKKNLLLDPLR